MHTEVLRWRISLRVCSMPICSPVADLTVLTERGFKSLVNEGNEAAFQSRVTRAHKLFSSLLSISLRGSLRMHGKGPLRVQSLYY